MRQWCLVVGTQSLNNGTGGKPCAVKAECVGPRAASDVSFGRYRTERASCLCLTRRGSNQPRPQRPYAGHRLRQQQGDSRKKDIPVRPPRHRIRLGRPKLMCQVRYRVERRTTLDTHFSPVPADFFIRHESRHGDRSQQRQIPSCAPSGQTYPIWIYLVRGGINTHIRLTIRAIGRKYSFTKGCREFGRFDVGDTIPDVGQNIDDGALGRQTVVGRDDYTVLSFIARRR